VDGRTHCRVDEEYCQNGADINRIPKDEGVQGYNLGAMIGVWKCSGGPQWMQLPEVKRRLDRIGFDISLNSLEARFVDTCRRLKTWQLQHGKPRSGGKNDDRCALEKSLYVFRYYTNAGKYNTGFMKKDTFRRLFEEAYAAGREEH
jgi:hypothetical protein